ncbi:MAG: hypothetical protein Q9201_004796 [Fulgogasparrea decipioides]
MSEYWKSTPKYWCKHCKTFVRDTKLEKAKHETTAKHQINIKRFLRDLHRGHEREEREKDKAKSEVERLNGVVSGTSAATKIGAPWRRQTAASSATGAREATPAERKAQLAKLAEMGVAVPEDFRREMAMAGDWHTIAERPVWDRWKEEGLEDFKNFKPDPTLNIGVRKRKLEGEDEDVNTEAPVSRKGWGSAVRRYPGPGGDGEDDLDALLSNTTVTKQEKHEDGTGIRLSQPKVEPTQDPNNSRAAELDPKPPPVKMEESETIDLNSFQNQGPNLETAIKQEDGDAQPAVVFKKRKSKHIEKP